MKNVYTEVNEILKLLGKSYIDRLPEKIYNLILEHVDNRYECKFKSIDEINTENCSQEAINMIALFHLNYWCDSDNEKEYLNKVFNENYIKKEEMLQKYNRKNYAQKLEELNNYKREIKEESVNVVKYKENFLKKFLTNIKNKISKIFQIK